MNQLIEDSLGRGPIFDIACFGVPEFAYRIEREKLADRKSQSNRIYAGGLSGAEVELCWRKESIAGTETGRKQIIWRLSTRQVA
jgi:hypothetical protein